MNSKNAQIIGNLFAGLVEIDYSQGNSIGWNAFFRLRVLVNVLKPLPTGFWSKDVQGVAQWFHIKYERLPDFCFFCGCMGHIIKGCKQREEEDYYRWSKTHRNMVRG